MSVHHESRVNIISPKIHGDYIPEYVDFFETTQGFFSDCGGPEHIRIMKTVPSTPQEGIKITLRNGLSIITTRDHIFPVIYASDLLYKQPACNLYARDNLLCPIKYWGDSGLKDEDLLKFLGVMMCEGNWKVEEVKGKSKGDAYIRIVQFEEDFKIEISRLLDAVIEHYNFPAKYYWDTIKKPTDVHGSYIVKFKARERNQKFLLDIYEWMESIVGSLLKSGNNYMSSEVSRWALFSGIFESDGFIDNTHNTLGINVSEPYRKDLYIQLFSKLGLAYRIQISQPFTSKTGIKHNKMYSFCFNHVETIERIYKNFKFVAKYKQESFDRVIKLRIKDPMPDHIYNGNCIKVPIVKIEKMFFTSNTFYDILTQTFTPILVNGIYTYGYGDVANEDSKGLGQG